MRVLVTDDDVAKNHRRLIVFAQQHSIYCPIVYERVVYDSLSTSYTLWKRSTDEYSGSSVFLPFTLIPRRPLRKGGGHALTRKRDQSFVQMRRRIAKQFLFRVLRPSIPDSESVLDDGRAVFSAGVCVAACSTQTVFAVEALCGSVAEWNCELINEFAEWTLLGLREEICSPSSGTSSTDGEEAGAETGAEGFLEEEGRGLGFALAPPRGLPPLGGKAPDARRVTGREGPLAGWLSRISLVGKGKLVRVAGRANILPLSTRVLE
ncbi:hypothetical protein B0H10DRAFT_2223725 [Mycena sp. CBHHK59/15]|nr:hypothetical protein B0H10DRAFT_2223725 [Mycena sp. CBHHK59/15]